MGLYGALALGALGGLGGLSGNEAEHDRLTAIMEKAKKYKDGVPRVYGGQQDELIAALSKGGADQSMADASVGRTELNKGLAERQAVNGALGSRAAMMSGGEVSLAGNVGRSAGSESVGNLAGAATNIGAKSADILARDRVRLEALRAYKEAKDARVSGLKAFTKGAANGMMAGAGLPV